jgi:hypothetical protein
VPEHANLRFVVGIFDGWEQLREALRDIQGRGLVLDSFNCIALQRVFAGKIIKAPDQASIAIRAIPFSGSPEPIACTSGPLADCLMERAQSGVGNFRDALGLWLILRHAIHFEKAVLAGKILLWIRVADADDERRAQQSLLALSSNTIGVHDFLSTERR